VLGFTLWIAGTPVVTRRLTVEYLLPVPLHQPHRIAAHIVSRDGRALNVTGTGTGSDGVTCFTASAVFVTVSTDHFAAHGELSGFGDLLERFAATSQAFPDSPGATRNGNYDGRFGTLRPSTQLRHIGSARGGFDTTSGGVDAGFPHIHPSSRRDPGCDVDGGRHGWL
jgi:hypothetical protein